MPEEPIRDESFLPPELTGDLASLYRQAVPPPAGFDASVLREARGVLGRSKRRSKLRWAAVAVAAAAAVTIVVWPRSPLPVQGLMAARYVLGPAPRPGERVNILAAYRLARALRQGEKPTADWDRTGDGKVDQADVDALAADAVRIDLGDTP